MATDSKVALESALRLGVEGNGAGMLQLLRRVLRNPPEELLAEPALLRIITTVANEATPPAMPMRALRESGSSAGATTPRPVDSPRMHPPADSERWGDRSEYRTVGELPEALTLDDVSDAVQPILDDIAAVVIDDVVSEHREDYLRSVGIAPTRTLLLTGEPGTGKTMTARWIAAAMGRELLTIDLGSLMSHELGRSASNLQVAIRTAARRNAVLFIDELDAIAKSRGDSTDVGEVKRLVNVFLLELDQWPDGHLLIGATNHPELLDRAVGRRFERRASLATPSKDSRAKILTQLLPEMTAEAVAVAVDLTEGTTGSDLRTLSLHARRKAARAGRTVLLGDIVQGLQSVPVLLPKSRRDRVIMSLNAEGLSGRAIASIVGVTHPTVANVIRAATGSSG